MDVALRGDGLPGSLDPLPCGGVPRLWPNGYRCDRCSAAPRSVGMSAECRRLLDVDSKLRKAVAGGGPYIQVDKTVSSERFNALMERVDFYRIDENHGVLDGIVYLNRGD